jgi:hypothetical protein
LQWNKLFKYPRVFGHVNVPHKSKTVRTTARDLVVLFIILCSFDATLSWKD